MARRQRQVTFAVPWQQQGASANLRSLFRSSKRKPLAIMNWPAIMVFPGQSGAECDTLMNPRRRHHFRAHDAPVLIVYRHGLVWLYLLVFHISHTPTHTHTRCLMSSSFAQVMVTMANDVAMHTDACVYSLERDVSSSITCFESTHCFIFFRFTVRNLHE